ncbi:hypothetical protein KC845_03790, partial [Candidatus Kaiserbacteria bacterium]|nr:hypothetical protein [Candidatus Kaiserbacteria bacterium]
MTKITRYTLYGLIITLTLLTNSLYLITKVHAEASCGEIDYLDTYRENLVIEDCDDPFNVTDDTFPVVFKINDQVVNEGSVVNVVESDDLNYYFSSLSPNHYDYQFFIHTDLGYEEVPMYRERDSTSEIEVRNALLEFFGPETDTEIYFKAFFYGDNDSLTEEEKEIEYRFEDYFYEPIP